MHHSAHKIHVGDLERLVAAATNPFGTSVTVDSTAACEVAHEIDVKIQRATLMVPFAAWVLKAIGRDTDIMRSFLKYLEELSEACPRETEGQQTFEVNPLVQRDISGCIQNISISFITDPLADVFGYGSEYDREEFDFLSHRFQYVGWDLETFSTDLEFFRGVRDLSPVSLARLVASEDLRCFKESGTRFSEEWKSALGRSWSRRSYGTCICVKTSSKYVDPLIKLAKCLYKQRNFHGASAIGNGLKSALVSNKFRGISSDLMSEEDNYLAYRTHLREIRIRGESALPFVFPIQKQIELNQQTGAMAYYADLRSFESYRVEEGHRIVGIVRFLRSCICLKSRHV